MDSLSPVDSACLNAVCARSGTMSSIALRAKLTMKEAAASLTRLGAMGLVRRADRFQWEAHAARSTPARRRARKGAVRPGSSAERMIALLDRPRTGVEIASALDVTLQRVRQLVVQLSAQGLVQVADPDQPLRAVWCTGDKVVVLNATAAKVLSAVPERRGTTSHKVAVATRRPIEEVKRALSELVRRRFVLREADVFSLTRAGADHWQRRPNARRAGATPLPVKSDRVQK